MKAHADDMLGWLAFICFLAMVAGLILHQISWIPCTTGAAVAILWFITVAWTIQRFEIGAKFWVSETFDRRWLLSMQIATIIMPLSLAFVGEPVYGVRINPQTGATTLDSSVIVAVPLLHSVTFVTDDYRPYASVTTTTRDGIPLHCTVNANGIKLDKLDVASLKFFLVDEAHADNPADYIDTTLAATLAKAAVAVISQRTTDEIERQQRFVIPYRIGTPVGDTFRRLHVVWREGSVKTSCAVAFSN